MEYLLPLTALSPAALGRVLHATVYSSLNLLERPLKQLQNVIKLGKVTLYFRSVEGVVEVCDISKSVVGNIG